MGLPSLTSHLEKFPASRGGHVGGGGNEEEDVGQQLVHGGMQQRACYDTWAELLPPSFPPLRTLHRVGNKTRLLLLQIIKNRRSVFTIYVHLIHNGKSGLEAVFDVTADLRGSVRLLPLERAGWRERGRVRLI